MSLRLGLDTGGTCTDAALLDVGGRVVASAKARTVHARPLEGLRPAARAVLAAAGPGAAARVTLVSLSTTLATNALVEGRGRPAGLVLMGAGPRLLDRADLRAALAGSPVTIVAGGHDAGGEPVAPLDVGALERFARARADEVEAWAVSATFAVRNPAHEREAARLLAELTGLPVSAGHALSSELDAPRRALTALLNARLLPPVRRLLDDARALLAELGIEAPLCVVRGDGTLVSEGAARAEPVQTVASGPAASVVGARHLAGLDDCTVVDLGGTTTDVAHVVGGAGRTAPEGANIGGLRTRVASLDLSSSPPGADAEVRMGRAAGRPGSSGPEVRLLARRVEPLAALAARHPGTVTALEAQLGRAVGRERDARFVMRADAHARAPASEALRELLEAIGRPDEAPVSLDALDAAGHGGPALERRIERLEASGHVARAGFTPTDAAHVLGLQATGDARAACLGAALLARRAGPDANVGDRVGAVGGGSGEGPAREVARATVEAVARGVASAVARAALAPGAGSPTVLAQRMAWIDELLLERAVDAVAGPGHEPAEPAGAVETHPGRAPVLRLDFRLASPIVGVGGPAHLYLPRAAALLGTRCVLPPHADVANAVGAVAGVVRRERRITIQPVGRHSVRVLLPDGPLEVAGLEAGAALASEVAEALVREDARAAGADRPVVTVTRADTVVTTAGERVLVESRVTAIATGRPCERGGAGTSGGRAGRCAGDAVVGADRSIRPPPSPVPGEAL